jgi:hypothetical protein
MCRRCNHTRHAHAHYSASTHCGLCECARFRRVSRVIPRSLIWFLRKASGRHLWSADHPREVERERGLVPTAPPAGRLQVRDGASLSDKPMAEWTI